MKENETNNQQDRELTDLISNEVDAILRELAEEAAAAAQTEAAAEAPAEEAEAVAEAEIDLADTADFPAIAEEDASEAELTEAEIEAACRQALEELLPEEADSTEPSKKIQPKTIVIGVSTVSI